MLTKEQFARSIEHAPRVLDTPIAPTVEDDGKHLHLPSQLFPSRRACLGRAGDQRHQRRAKLDQSGCADRLPWTPNCFKNSVVDVRLA